MKHPNIGAIRENRGYKGTEYKFPLFERHVRRNSCEIIFFSLDFYTLFHHGLENVVPNSFSKASSP